MRSLITFPLAAALLAQAPPSPQPPQDEPPPAISIDVSIVSILASVRDKKGALVPNLGKDEFTVLEDGKHQTIKYFSRESDLPLTIGLLVDVSNSQSNLIDVEKQAAAEFFEQTLRPKDMAFLIGFGEEAELLQDYTSSKKLLTAALNTLRVRGAVMGIHPGPVPTMSQPRGTILHDAVYLATAEKLKSEVGRKVVVVISDGVDQGSRVELSEAVAAAQKADAIIYSIEYYDRSAYGGSMAGPRSLDRLSTETGGRVFRVDRKHTLRDIFREIQEEMRSQYMLGYVSANEARDGGYRKIEIKTAQKGLKVQARKGYYAVTPGNR